MAEKISDRPIRDEKIKRLKAKILAEIEQEMSIIKNEIKVYLNDNEYFSSLIKSSFALLNLKEYIEREYSFQSIEAEYFNMDAVVYMVTERNIDIWLQEDYSFVINFLCKVEDYGYDVFHLLNDRYFGYSFTNILDGVVYDMKKKKRG